MRQYGLITAEPWTPEQTSFLREHYSHGDMPMLEQVLSRKQEAIYQKAHRLGLTRPKQKVFNRTPDPIIQELKRIRLAMGWSIKKLAKLSGHESIGKFERGYLQPQFWIVQNWAKALGLTLDLCPILNKSVSDNLKRMTGR